jgi:GAF domain-containing protein
LTSRIIKSGKPLIINRDTDRRTLELGAVVVGKQALSYLGVPILVAGTCQGAISVQSTLMEGVYDADSERLLSTIAANVGVALQNGAPVPGSAGGARRGPSRPTKRRARSWLR